MKILAISGSLRAGALNTHLLHRLADMAGSRADVGFADIGALPHYNQDLDGDPKPAEVAAFITAVSEADALLIATPEYNYSISGVLKNALDWASRPAYRSPLAQKPAAMLGASMSPVGTARAQAHLRQILGGTVTRLFPHPEVLIGAAHTRFDEAGQITDASTQAHLERFMVAFLDWVDAQQITRERT